ncbi:hypothetical protein ANANG_G00305560 [Anguilla anguilla]|uniref:Cold-shock domain-containing protein n=1 Tax=Anguilla anguilla TaxID=7936 RepID=A0A9D3RIN8_ANGAN|nr:hypothetical protein ANANG_G00305560 [Anguilla anguilla]
MMPGDRVQFSICTKRSTKAERATNIELLLNSLDHSQEQRREGGGVVMDLRESFGFIRCQRDPQLFFHLKEVLEESKLNLTDEVEFTVLPAAAGEGNQAVRVKKLLWSAFTATPKLEGLGAPTALPPFTEKKKMTIKLLRDSVNDEMKNLKVKIESFSTESATDEDPAEPVDENASSAEEGPEGESRNGARGGTEESSRATRAGKYRSPPREHGKRRSRSRSCERGHRHERRRRRSRSRSRERGGRSGSGRRRSRSRERADSSYSRRPGSRESTSRGGARRRSKSRTPERDGSSSRKKASTGGKDSSLAKDGRGGSREPLPRAYPNPATQELPRSENILDEELSRKKRELELLEEHIARRRAIIAMEQKGLAPKGQSNSEQDSESSGYFRFPLEPEGADKPAPLPMKSILKKRTEPFMDFGQQGEIPKNLPLKQNFVSQSCFGPPPVELPPFLQTSDEQSYFEPPPDRSPFSQSVSQREPVRHPSHSQSLFTNPLWTSPLSVILLPVSRRPPRAPPPLSLSDSSARSTKE